MKNIFLCLLLVISTLNVFSGNITVCSTCEIKSIKKAVEISPAHTIINIKPGVYIENDIKIDKPITLIGEKHPVIDGKNKGYILEVNSDSVTIIGLKVINVGKSYTKDFAAIHLFKSNHFVLSNNILETVFFGFLIEKSTP